jgi:hypothetical protein
VSAERFVDGFGVGKGIEKIGRDEPDIDPGLHAVVKFAAHAFAQVEFGTRGE